MSDFLCFGDHICLFCEETEGFVYSWEASSAHNGIFIYQWQDREKPGNIPNPQAVTFEVCIQNRYKLNKKYRKWLPKNQDEPENLESRTLSAQARMAADAENDDNVSEQRRQHGKRVRYGEIIQLRHVFTRKYIHVSTTQTSRKDKNNMLVYLQSYNAKHAQFKINPRYKVKSEGEYVQILDQIVLESVKSPGQYFHSSAAWKIDHFAVGAELNLGIQPAGFTVVKNYRPTDETKHLVKGGSAIRMFHKELEAYLVAEGLFDDEVSEDVHLRIREVDQLIPKSLYPSTSGNTYWQIEAESSILNGDVIRWEQQVRFRHMCTRQYLCITADRSVTLTPDAKDPRTVFRLHPVIKEMDEIQFEAYARIEHVISGYWLHALRDGEYVRRGYNDESGDSMKSLRWDGASLRKISASGEKMYHDAYTLQLVEDMHMHSFNFVAGMVPFLLNLVLDRQENKILNAKKTHKTTAALKELKDFMIVHGIATKERQKLMRNLRVIDLLVRLLQCSLQNAIDQTHLTKVFKGAYDVLYTYMIGNSRKNALYFAKNIEFFQTQISVKGDIGLNVAQMIVELIRDNRKIVDRITKEQIEEFVALLKINKNYRYLDLLNVLCVCDGVAIPDNQSYIVDAWLRRDRVSARFLTERGQNVNGQPNIIYISIDNGSTWTPLHEFVDKENNLSYSEEDVMFFEHQLDLMGKLAYGRNDFSIYVITRELGILTWDEAFLSLRSTLLPDALRSKYCELIIGLFIDVGTNYSVLDHTNLSFIYEDVLSPGPNADGEFVKKLPPMDNWISPGGIIKDLVTLFPVIRDWISEFLLDNRNMTASHIGKNMLIDQVLRLFHFLVKFGYYNSDDIKLLIRPLLNLLNGRLDNPFPPDNEKGGYTKDSLKVVNHWRNKDRFERSAETEAIVNAKFQAMEVLDLLLTFQFNTRLESFIAKFKTAETTADAKKRKQQSVLSPLLYEDFDPFDTVKKSLKVQKRALKDLRMMFDQTSYFDSDQITSILMDLSNYKYDQMVTKSLLLLNKYYSAKTRLFKMAVQALVLITTDSCHVHREVARTMPILRRYSKSKLNDDQVKTMGTVLDRYTEFCHLPKEELERHPMNQNILINQEVLTLVFDILSTEIDAKLMEQYKGIQMILKKSLRLMKALAMGNDMVQMRIFERLDTLLRIKVVESDLAIALKEAFIGNQVTCLKILPQQIQTIVELSAEHKENAPEFLGLLNVIVRVEGLGLTLKRNQAYVMKYIMQDYNRVAYVLDQPREIRERILTNQSGRNHLSYLIHLVDLLATCAEGENRFIESMCQTIMGIDELLWVMNHPDVDVNLKKPYLRYLMWVYMKTAGSAVESGAGDLPHDSSMWKFFTQLVKEASELTEFITRNEETTSELLKLAPDKCHVSDADDLENVVHCSLHYFFDAVMPVIQAFYGKFYSPEKESYPNEIDTTEKLARGLVALCEVCIPLASQPSHLKAIISCLTSIIPASTISNSVMENIVEQMQSSARMRDAQLNTAKGCGVFVKGHREYYAGELELNAKLRTFAVNCSLLYGGHNTVSAQLKVKSKRQYTVIGGDEELPLGEEFQDHLRRFLKPSEKKVNKRIELVNKLVDQLAISASASRKSVSELQRIEQEELDVRCLQLLRAVIYNEERKLPEDWEEHPSDHKKQVALIQELQITMNDMGAVIKVLPHLARPCDKIVKEVLAFVCIMLFNANHKVQSALLDYFLQTREESFFAAIRNRMHLSALAIKERRSLAAQQRARVKEVMAQAKSMSSTMSVGKKALQRKVSLSTLQSKAAKRRDEQKKKPKPVKKPKPPKEVKQNGPALNGIRNQKMKDSQTLINEMELQPITVTIDPQEENKSNSSMIKKEEEEMEDFEQKDDGHIELVLRVLARMCDGQHEGLQDYLREQPDNMKSFNIVAETAHFLNLVYSNITPQNIELVVQLFETLNEFTVGNQQNRAVMLNNKVVDYINFILRTSEFKNCPTEQVIDLKCMIGNVIISLIEENSPESLQVAKEIKDTLDKEAVYRCMASCFEMSSPERPKLEVAKGTGNRNIGVTLQSARNLAKFGSRFLHNVMENSQNADLKEKVDEVGFIYYLILARIQDLDPRTLTREVNTVPPEIYQAGKRVAFKSAREEKKQRAFKEDLQITPLQQEAFNHYKKNSMSIEVLKEDNLQRINFRVKNRKVLRDEVKEKLIWSVDRSSPSNKIRDLMKWSKDIIKDIYYQRKILSNPIATFFTKNWLMWNRMTLLLSVAINMLMLATWNARASLKNMNIPANASAVPPELYDPRPHVELAEYDVIIYSLGGAHNFFSFLVLVTYFLSNHPTFPNISSVGKKVKSLCSSDKKEEDGKAGKTHESKLEVHFLSFATFYYFIFLGASVAGTIFQGYFFAFHLLNVVNNNQLLKGVIQAITQNGRSLLWVAILGFIIFYLYALISFAMLRASFDPNSDLYCDTLWQCTVTVIRYGLIGDIFENLTNHPAENTFVRFGFLVIFHLSFFIFITTIGLNIIFGIIVDTFSELRDLKWTAERDMRDTCFICSRNSYDFEHHGLGFDHHINAEHCVWSYIFFFIHLDDTKQSDYTALELYVFRLLQQEKYDFFPLNRALSLSIMDEDSTDSKVDELLRYVVSLVEKQKEEDSKRKREEERQKQIRWREEHANAIMADSSMDPLDNTCTGMSSLVHSSSTLPLNRGTNSQRQRQKRWQRDMKSHGPPHIDSLDTQDSNVTLDKFKSVDTHLEPTTTMDSLETAQAESPFPPPPPPLTNSPVSSGARTPIIGGIDGQILTSSRSPMQARAGSPLIFDDFDKGAKSAPMSDIPQGDMQLIDLGPVTAPPPLEREPTQSSLTLIPDFLTGSTVSIPQGTPESRGHSPSTHKHPEFRGRSPSIGVLPIEPSDSVSSFPRPPIHGDGSKSTSGSLSRTSSRLSIPPMRPPLETDIDELPLPRFVDIGTQVGSSRVDSQVATRTPSIDVASSGRRSHERRPEADDPQNLFGSSSDLRTTRV